MQLLKLDHPCTCLHRTRQHHHGIGQGNLECNCWSFFAGWSIYNAWLNNPIRSHWVDLILTSCSRMRASASSKRRLTNSWISILPLSSARSRTINIQTWSCVTENQDWKLSGRLQAIVYRACQLDSIPKFLVIIIPSIKNALLASTCFAHELYNWWLVRIATEGFEFHPNMRARPYTSFLVVSEYFFSEPLCCAVVVDWKRAATTRLGCYRYPMWAPHLVNSRSYCSCQRTTVMGAIRTACWTRGRNAVGYQAIKKSVNEYTFGNGVYRNGLLQAFTRCWAMDALVFNALTNTMSYVCMCVYVKRKNWVGRRKR